MLRQRTLLLSIYLLAFSASLILALPPGTSWTSFVSKPVYSRALGPPIGMDTISVPYMPKSPFFPKFVDPKTLISKKTDMLSNLFGGLGPVAYNMADAKPSIPYGASGFSVDNIGSANALLNKREIVQNGKEKAIDSDIYKRGIFSPFASKFSPMSPKFGPVTPFSSPEISDYLSKTPFSRKRRSIAPSSADDINSIPSSLSYSKDPQIVENPSTTKSAANGTPKEYLPGIFGPFGPGGPFGSGGPFGPSSSFGPVMDPSIFTAKKSAFLDTLFKNLATSTPATTEIPTPKSTIVPASFWLPSSIIASPTEYTQKVSDFLDKLFDSIKLNVTAQETDDSSSTKSDFMRSLKSDDILPDKNARSLDDASSIAAAKDAIVDIILSELGNLKSDMIATLNDLIAYEKTAATTATKKPFKPFSGIFPFTKPTVDPTLPFQQRMTVLSQVFDMLTDLQKNITVVAKGAITANTGTSDSSEELPRIPLTGSSPINNTLLDAILKKISVIDPATTSYSASLVKENPIITRALSKEPTSFWVSYPENSASAVKRQVDDDLESYLGYENDNNRHDHKQYTRGVKMQMHQGYQSLPAGSVESVQAGGGSTPGHQGGGIKLLESNAYGNLNKWADWMQYHNNEYQDHRHHHNQH